MVRVWTVVLHELRALSLSLLVVTNTLTLAGSDPTSGCGCCEERVSSLVLKSGDLTQNVDIYATSKNEILRCCAIEKRGYETNTNPGDGLTCLAEPAETCNVNALKEGELLAFFKAGCNEKFLKGDECAFATNTVFSTESRVSNRRLSGLSRMLPSSDVTVTVLGSVHTSCSGSNNVLGVQIGADYHSFDMVVVGATSSAEGKRLCEDESQCTGKGKGKGEVRQCEERTRRA